MNRPYVTNSLEKVIGAYRFGKYQQADVDRPFAFNRIQDIWGQSLEDKNSEVDKNNDDSDQEGDEANRLENPVNNGDVANTNDNGDEANTDNNEDEANKDDNGTKITQAKTGKRRPYNTPIADAKGNNHRDEQTTARMTTSYQGGPNKSCDAPNKTPRIAE
eukprot:CAMPEP_0178935682 /NCGR_PEP_ID=MMETSP0786-20121207/24691_1 /TAXON_ID=186022 /ORGANISM="Thalassionema frauenfeldii, Strain CCMP 1798" /LENGTH=160 /DNA_ID=CAMNT_0020613877 /DNA_START=2172 /DNA_END=2654 /DNA_ORIENTATION=+